MCTGPGLLSTLLRCSGSRESGLGLGWALSLLLGLVPRRDSLIAASYVTVDVIENSEAWCL